MKFKKGDIIQRPNKEAYSHASIYSGSFVVTNIVGSKYTLQQSQFFGNMDIETADNIFIIDENPKGYAINIKDHILKH